MQEVAVYSFNQPLEEALKHYQDPAWLGERSPLTTP